MTHCLRCGRELPQSRGGTNPLCADCRASVAGTVPVPAAAPGPASRPVTVARKRPPAPLTAGLVGINVAVFLAMALAFKSFSEPNTAQLIRWGADWGPRSLGAQPWRMLSSNYVHIGLLHILFNMWCLWDLGNLAERIFDKATYLLTYTACGIAGSLSSLWWHPLVVGAGASGAIFGLAGALITALYLGRLPIPKQAVRHTLRSLVIFAGYNLFFGAVGAGIDNSAHIGGLVTGLVLGGIMAKHLTSSVEERGRWRLGVFAVTALILLSVFSFVKRANGYVVPLEQAVDALQNNRPEEAIRNLQKADSEKPSQSVIQGLLGDAYVQHGDYAKAEPLLQRRVQERPQDADAQYNLGFAELKLGKLDQAIPLLQKASELDPNDPDPQQALGEAYRSKNMQAQAEAAFQKADELRKTPQN